MNLALFNTKHHLWKCRTENERDVTVRLPWGHQVLDLVDNGGVGGGGEHGAASSRGWIPLFLGLDLGLGFHVS